MWTLNPMTKMTALAMAMLILAAMLLVGCGNNTPSENNSGGNAPSPTTPPSNPAMTNSMNTNNPAGTK